MSDEMFDFSYWVNPLFDRTQADVDFAIAKIAEWKSTGSTNTYDLKGCFNASDLYRIETDIKVLSDTLSTLYYFPYITHKEWSIYELPDVTDVSRIIGNVRKIISAYFQYDDAPALPETMLTYQQINDIERNLYLLKEILDNMMSSFRECGNFNCGEE